MRAQTDEDWELSKEKSLIFVLGPSVLGEFLLVSTFEIRQDRELNSFNFIGMPALCSVILPFTFPAYTRQWAMYHCTYILLLRPRATD